ncbi:hypothetical protein SAMN05660380_02237, partial [Xylella fastidiosa]
MGIEVFTTEDLGISSFTLGVVLASITGLLACMVSNVGKRATS